MAAKKVTRKELLKGTDEFMSFSARAVEWIRGHIRLLQYVGITVAIAIVAYLAVTNYFRYVNRKGHEAYSTAYDIARKTMSPDAEPDDLKKSEELFLKVHDDYGMSKAAKLALPQIAYAKFVEKKYDEAIALYKDFLKKVSGNRANELLAHLALASCYEAKGENQAAISHLTPILDSPDHPFRETAMLSLARLYRLENNSEKERETLEKFAESYKDSPFLPMVKARL